MKSNEDSNGPAVSRRGVIIQDPNNSHQLVILTPKPIINQPQTADKIISVSQSNPIIIQNKPNNATTPGP